MTEQKNGFKANYALLLLSISLILFSFFHIREMLMLVNSGIRVAIRSVVPSLFPFMIFSEMLLYSDIFERLPKKLNNLFEKAFKIRQAGLGAFVTGIVCGFPLGVKYACELYEGKKINKDELQRLICFSNNTGPAFLLAGVGISIRNNVYDGIIIYIVQIASAILCGFLLSFGKKCGEAELQEEALSERNFDFPQCIKKSALNMMYVCAFVVFFSIVCGYLRIIFPNPLFAAFSSSFFEIGNAAIACNEIKNRSLSLVLTAGAVSFSGMSVHFQAKIYCSEYKLSQKLYYTSKIFQAAVSMILSYLISLLTSYAFIDKI